VLPTWKQLCREFHDNAMSMEVLKNLGVEPDADGKRFFISVASVGPIRVPQITRPKRFVLHAFIAQTPWMLRLERYTLGAGLSVTRVNP
jgi:hypothetical protein